MPAYGRHWAADPFVEAGQLAQGEINAIMDGLTRWEKLLAQLASASAAASLGYSNSDQDGDVAEQVDEARESLLGRLAGIDDQLSAFDDAIEAAAANPSQFHVSEEEIARRRLRARVHLFFCLEIYGGQLVRAVHFLHEHPQGATSWQQPAVRALMSRSVSRSRHCWKE